jgi:TonB family protein
MEGTVTIEVTVGTTGTVTSTRVVRASSQIFVEAALAAVKQWIYRPATLDGVAVEWTGTQVVTFGIRSLIADCRLSAHECVDAEPDVRSRVATVVTTSAMSIGLTMWRSNPAAAARA